MKQSIVILTPSSVIERALKLAFDQSERKFVCFFSLQSYCRSIEDYTNFIHFVDLNALGSIKLQKLVSVFPVKASVVIILSQQHVEEKTYLQNNQIWKYLEKPFGVEEIKKACKLEIKPISDKFLEEAKQASASPIELKEYQKDIKEVIEQYCQEHFRSIAREIIEKRIRQLTMEEKQPCKA